MKRCSICKVEKELIDFKKDKRRNDGCSSSCKECIRIKGLEYYYRTKDEFKTRLSENRKRTHQKNKEEENKKSSEYKRKNSQKIKEYNKSYREKNKEKCQEISKNYRKNNLTKIKEYQKKYFDDRLKNDNLFKLSHYTRSMIRKSFKRNGYSKKSKAQEILGCSFMEFKLHIESKFETWMNWENYGLYNGEDNYGWDLDHIIPLSSATSEEELIELNHFSNFQPLCSKVNRFIKRGDIIFTNLP